MNGAATRPKRKRRRRLVGAALLVLVAASVFGCTSTITPPPAPAQPVTVFLLREALHAGVVFPPLAPGGDYVEFGYGDWSWFALGHDAWYHVFATVLWPTQGALGRRPFAARDAAALPRAAWWADVTPLQVEAELAKRLHERLQQQFDAGVAAVVQRRDLGFSFVPWDRSYWFVDNCADVAAEWFTELGCSVGWAPVRGGLQVAGP